MEGNSKGKLYSGSSLQRVDQIPILGIHPGTQPAETGADRDRPGQSPDIVSSNPNGPSPSTRKGQDDGS